ncbi:iojap-like ribosome-associated protein [Aphanomyces invadans]|uniref:Iojap-like ribosome-associated protein n=1 Tax=Aphanomyces invadans TaxID=157072 RepID=A0A024TRJ4_9STRA|nr:iojap-like ribosome-associated protein [Aphanomyces invadans]ETV95927.1 iojap-like ribosome-associated protein [Aphanomyces invadans]|eukprot:XP_008875238.1 iojap-like ribosome-associated protein [Aphanomyces invadans]
MLVSRLKHISAVAAAVRPSSKRVLRASMGINAVSVQHMARGVVSFGTRSMAFHTSRSVLKVIDSDHNDEVTKDNNEHDEDCTAEKQMTDEGDDEDAEEDEGVPSESYTGVTFHTSRIKKWSASVTVGNIEVDAGQFWTEEDAAKGYDELVRMYLEPGAPLNFPDGQHDDDEDASYNLASTVPHAATSHDWTLPDAGSRHADIIPPIPKTYLTMDELLPALEREQAIDVYTIDLAGKSSLASHMVFCTGRSRNHMRRMADMVILSMKARNMDDDFGYVVEGRDCDDWMIADVNNIVVHFMTAETRKMLALEDHWENMVNDKHRLYGHLSEDEYMDKYGMSTLLTEDDFLHEDSIDHTVWK